MSNESRLNNILAEHLEEKRRKDRGLMAASFTESGNHLPFPTLSLGAAPQFDPITGRTIPSQPYKEQESRIGVERTRQTDAKVSDPVNQSAPEYTGGSVSYYRVKVEKPTSPDVKPYVAECNDIIESLNLNYAEGNALKAIWRMAAARMGKSKQGYTDGLYDAEKVEFFGKRLVEQNKAGV